MLEKETQLFVSHLQVDCVLDNQPSNETRYCVPLYGGFERWKEYSDYDKQCHQQFFDDLSPYRARYNDWYHCQVKDVVPHFPKYRASNHHIVGQLCGHSPRGG